MIDLPYSSRCRRDECPRRSVRNALCLDHWHELHGTGYGPWPADIEPESWRDRYLQRTGTSYAHTRETPRATA